VGVLGPRARDWAARTRSLYPAATPDGLARLATRRFVRRAGGGAALTAVAGVFAPLAELALVSWNHVALVLHLAAAYGHDPTHPDRAVDLLVLLGLQPDDDAARSALVAAGSTAGGRTGITAPTAGREPARTGWRVAGPLLAQGGGWLAARVAARVLPGATVVAAVGGGSAGAERLAARAVARYRAVPGVTAS
jgi:hypothetical protein